MKHLVPVLVLLSSCAAFGQAVSAPGTGAPQDPGTCQGDQLSTRCEGPRGYWCCSAGQECGQESPAGGGECWGDTDPAVDPGSLGPEPGGYYGARRRVHIAPEVTR